MTQFPDQQLPVRLINTTEVISEDRLAAYEHVASTLGGAVVLEQVAGPGDSITVVPAAGFRLGNRRDRGTLVGVNHEPTGEDEAMIPLRDGQVAVVVERPAQHDPVTGHTVSGFSMWSFYEATNEEYKRIRAERAGKPQGS